MARWTGRNGALGAVVVGCFLAGCGGGGGGDDGGSSSPTPAPAPAPAPAPSPAGNSVTAALATGTYWEYLADQKSVTASASPTSPTSDWGIFRITLGAPMTVAGVSGFAVATTGKPSTGGHDYTPKYRFIGITGQRWVGSVDGTTLVTLYDPSLTSGSNGFFLNLGSTRPVKTQAATFDGQYNDFTGVSLVDSSSSGGCEYVLSTTICSQNSTSFSQLDYLKDGIGPVGFKYHTNISFGGTAPSVVDNSLSLELIGTSLLAADGSALKAPPWALGPDLAVARANSNAAVTGGKIYLYTGTAVDSFDPATQAWSSLPAAPISVTAAVSVGTRIAAFNNLRGMLHNPTTSTWTAMATLTDPSGATTVEGTVPWTHADGTTDVVLLVSRGNIYTTFNVWQYQTASNTWISLGAINRGGYSGFGVASAGDKVYLFGGFQSGNYLSNVMALDLVAKTLTDTRNALTTHGVSQAAQVLNGKIYVAGGNNAAGVYRTVDVIDPASGAVTAGPAMYEGRNDAAAAVVNGKLYIIAGQASGMVLKTMEVLTP